MLLDFEYIEFYVGNAKQSAHFYKSIFGFVSYAYSGPETGNRDFVSYVLKNNKIYFVITSPLNKDDYISKWLNIHGDGVADVACSSDNITSDYDFALENGATSYSDIEELIDDMGTYKQASLMTYGDTRHTLVDRSDYKGVWKPGFISILEDETETDLNLLCIDHVVGNVENNKMNHWVDYYKKSFNFDVFAEFTENDIATKYSSLRSKVVKSINSKIKLPINEPADGLKKSQIQEYIDSNNGAGVQHIAILTDDIISSVSILKSNGIEFLDVPDSYYDYLFERVGSVDEDVENLKKLRILIDRDSDGYLLQLFTKPLQDRPTLFIEIIQRKGCQGFGKGNFKALFESIEREQEKRGNL